ncbi:MAG: adenylate cyclase [Candidatus Paceibacterota bacterium]
MAKSKKKSTKEIERKYLLGSLPVDGILMPADYIIYTTVYLSAGDPEIRARKKISGRGSSRSETHSLTFKFGQGIERDEFINPIDPELFNKSLQKYKHMAVYKDRWKIGVGSLVWEIDKFAGRHAGLLIAEIELDRKDQEVYIPEWLDVEKEVTDDPRYYNKNLATFGIPNPR